MIVDPDFLDHWRTQMLTDLLGGDPLAPVYVLRLWGHCQVRRADRFDIPPAALKAICRAPHDANEFERAMTEAGFVLRNGETLVAAKWAEHNAKLVSNWKNGTSGGRPPKPNDNPPETQPKPNDNPPGLWDNPPETDKRREEKIGEKKEKTPMSGKPDPEARPPAAKQAEEVIEHLNVRAGKRFRPVQANVGLVLARLREGATVEDCKAVIDRKVAKWGSDPKMAEYLRPATLFGKEKFAQYLGEVGPAGPAPRSVGQWWLSVGHGTRESAIAAGIREPA